jgi:hypothetical protein
MRGPLLAAFIAVSPAIAVAQQTAAPAPAQPDVDLKLFEKGEADRGKGCTVALWQADRDPDKDRYAISFIEQLHGRDNLRMPARIKIGAAFVPLQRVAVGGKTEGYGLYPYQLYRMPDEGNYVVLDLKLGGLEGEAIDIASGTMTVVMRGQRVFRQTVKGGAGCMGAPITSAQAQALATPSPATAASRPPVAQAPVAQPPAAPPPASAPRAAAPAAPYQPPAMFTRYAVRAQQMPRAFLAQLERSHACSAEMMRSGTVGFQMSEESAIWQVPCERFAYQASSVFVLVYLPDPAVNLTFLDFEAPKGRSRTAGPSTLFNPEWDVRSRTVSSFALARGAGDCGVFERHRVTVEGKFELLEYREKTTCDGKADKPEAFPLVHRAR